MIDGGGVLCYNIGIWVRLPGKAQDNIRSGEAEEHGKIGRKEAGSIKQYENAARLRHRSQISRPLWADRSDRKGGRMMQQNFTAPVNIRFFHPSQADDASFAIAVIVTRCGTRWVYCRHRERSSWEMPGGHREPGESMDQAARRELAEETGAAEADLTRICAYHVEDDPVYGMLYYATIDAPGTLPVTSEMTEVALFETPPAQLTYPAIHSALFCQVQGWLNVRSGAGELWDVYDENRMPTGRVHRRGDDLRPGEFHLVVHAWLMNSRGEYLLTKRSPGKGFPGMWETPGGSALAGEGSLAAALREVREETGLMPDPACGRCIFTCRREDNFLDVWLFRFEYDPEQIVLQQGETCAWMSADRDTLRRLAESGALVPFPYSIPPTDSVDDEPCRSAEVKDRNAKKP